MFFEGTQRGSYWDGLKFQAPGLTRWQSWGMYRYFFDFFSMMLLGMVLFRAGFFRGRAPPRALWTMILLGYGVGLTVNYFEVSHILREEFSVLSFLRTNITYDVGRIPLTMGHLGLLLLFAQSPGFDALKRALAAVGRMAFTNYVMTSVICAFVFYGFGFGLYGELQRHQLYYVVAGIWLFQLVVSPLWLARYRFGPLEWLWRWLTYGERPVMRRGWTGTAVFRSPLAASRGERELSGPVGGHCPRIVRGKNPPVPDSVLGGRGGSGSLSPCEGIRPVTILTVPSHPSPILMGRGAPQFPVHIGSWIAIGASYSHRPRVKSGIGTDRLRSATDTSDSGVMTLHASPSQIV